MSVLQFLEVLKTWMNTTYSFYLLNWYVEELEEFLPQVNITSALVQNEIHPYYQENDVIPYIQDLGIEVQGWYPLGGRGHTAEFLGNEVISKIAETHGVSSAQVILRWNLQKGVALAKEQSVDLILGVGGGSVMDCCKAISLAAAYEGNIWNDFWERPGVIGFPPIPLGVIVTVAGTGSEMNGGAVITNEVLKAKTGRDYPECNPVFALLDPAYAYSVSKFQMVLGGFDILSHIMETYLSEPDENNVSDDISEALMRGG